MEPEYLIVLYSKYSPQCQKILQIYDKSTMDYIKMICVDNSNLRERLMVSKTIQIKTVPCVLLIYPGNKVEKFEGSGVLDWILQQISQNLPNTDRTILEPIQQQPIQQQPIQQQPIQQQPIQQQPIQQQQTLIEDLQSDMASTVEASTRKDKSINEIAAEMAAEREDVDKPAHIQMQEMNHAQTNM